MSTTPSTAAWIARNVKQLRKARNLSQEQSARSAGVPRATWANLESGTANPTVSVLTKVAVAFQVSVEELLNPHRGVFKFYPVSALQSARRGSVLVRKLLPDSIQNMALDRMELPPGSRMTGIPHRTGTREYLTCETGEVVLTVSEETLRLTPGDVVVFRGDQKHSYSNPGKGTAVAYSIVVLRPMSD
jgi:XRE family transcriptional regulator, regulator of sulfur utilization